MAHLAWFLGVAIAAAPQASADGYDDVLDEVVVRPEGWARWDHTRWRVDAQVMLPYPVLLGTNDAGLASVVAYDLHYVIACDIAAGGGRRRAVVDCEVEDLALQAAPWPMLMSRTEMPLTAVRDLLIGMTLRLRVRVDGQVMRVDLDDAHTGALREAQVYDDIRQLMSLTLVGFHMRTPESFGDGDAWIDRRDMVLAPPVFRYVGLMSPMALAGRHSAAQSLAPLGTQAPTLSFPADLPRYTNTRPVPTEGRARLPVAEPVNTGWTTDAALPIGHLITRDRRRVGFLELAPSPLANSVTRHLMTVHEGNYIVESRGEGSFDMGLGYPLIYTGTADAVSVFDGELGIMTERVWAVQMKGRVEQHNMGMPGWPYAMIGRLTWLDPDGSAVDLGRSGLVRPPRYGGMAHLPPWPVPR